MGRLLGEDWVGEKAGVLWRADLVRVCMEPA
jgi:hypothetical protein